MNSNENHLQKKLEKHFSEKERRKRKRMKVSGKQVFALQKLMEQPKRRRKRK